ncbi:MAG: hypothetical protein ACOCVF_03475 [bacterium]
METWRDNLNNLSDEQLRDIVADGQRPTVADDSLLRQIAQHYYGKSDTLTIQLVGLMILPIITERMVLYSPHINGSDNYI